MKRLQNGGWVAALVLCLGFGVGCNNYPGPIFDAVRHNSAAEVKSAIASGEPVDKRGRKGRTPLFIAVYQGQIAAADALLDAGADPGAVEGNGKTPLMYAAGRGYFDLLKKMIAKKPNLNWQDKRGMTAAHAAAESGIVESVRLLRDAGADIKTIRDKKGRTVNDLLAIKQLTLPESAPRKNPLR